MKPILKKDIDGAEYPFCPKCGEPVYFQGYCCFCGQVFDYTDNFAPERMVAVGEYMVAQASNHHVTVHGSDGRMVAHFACGRVLTDNELIELVGVVCDLKGDNDG